MAALAARAKSLFLAAAELADPADDPTAAHRIPPYPDQSRRHPAAALRRGYGRPVVEIV